MSGRDELNQALDRLNRLYRILAEYRVKYGDSRQFGLLVEAPLEELRGIQAEIEAYVGMSRVLEGSVPLWIRIVGASITGGSAPSSVLTAVLDIVRKGVQAAAEFLASGTLSTRPTAELKRACDLRAVAFVPGSLQIGLALPEGAEEPDQTEQVVVQALKSYLAAAGWAASDENEESLISLLPEQRLRKLLLTEVLRLAPRVRGEVDAVELSGVYMPTKRPARLVRSTRDRLRTAIARSARERVESYTGYLREIDLDAHSFTIRGAAEIGQDIRCTFPEELLETAKDSLDKRVQVTGVRILDEIRRATAVPLVVTSLEVVEEESPG
jgi:hypothetical protein